MILEELVIKKPILTEAIKPRIDHPEDLVWQKGSRGFFDAIKAMMFISQNPQAASIKFDGTPALIFGRDPQSGKVTVTDKSGFGATKYDGHAQSASQLYDMFYSRKPGDPERMQFSRRMANLWPLLASVLPSDFSGYLKGDLLYTERPPAINGFYYFRPNKITYRVPIDSALGKAIAVSQAGIVVHGYIADRDVTVPDPINDIAFLNSNPKLLVIPAGSTNAQAINVDRPKKPKNIQAIDALFDPQTLKDKQIIDFGKKVGSFIAGKAGRGEDGFDGAAEEFQDWLNNNDKITAKKKFRMTEHIKQNEQGYDAFWKAVGEVHRIKMQIKSQLDDADQEVIQAAMKGQTGHEGYVATTPNGKIKLVDRAVFMAKDD